MLLFEILERSICLLDEFPCRRQTNSGSGQLDGITDQEPNNIRVMSRTVSDMRGNVLL
jgi:hypothetical protein